jgi:hypothetical protein
VKHPGIIFILLEPARDCGPKLAAGTFIHPSNGVFGRWNGVDPIAIQLAYEGLSEVPDNDFSLLDGGN